MTTQDLIDELKRDESNRKLEFVVRLPDGTNIEGTHEEELDCEIERIDVVPSPKIILIKK